MGLKGRILTAAVLLTLGFSGQALAQSYMFEPQFHVGGYISTQVGVFIAPDTASEALDPDAKLVYPTNHGDKLGELSMFRATLFLEADWQPYEPVTLHAIFRGTRSLQVPSDARDAEPPLPSEVDDTAAWVRDNYYNEFDLRELYVDIQAAEWWSLRLGRQQVSWGELGQYRLLDVVNPSDTTWHFGPLESFEDTRIPLWMVETLIDIPALQGALEVVWIPLLDPPHRTVTTPLTFTGAWGLPLAPAQEDKGVAAQKIHSKNFAYPGGDIDDSRIGARWKGEIGNLTYSLAYMYTHQLSPPIPTHYIAPWKSGAQGLDVYLEYPRQHIAGFSLEYPFESPLGIVSRLEFAYEPDRTFPIYSLGNKPVETRPSATSREDGAIDVWTFMPYTQKHVITYGLQLMRPTMIRALNPAQNFIFVLQFMHSVILDFDKQEHLIDVPGFDTTLSKEHSFTVVAVATTSYLNGLIQPVLIGAYLPPGDGFFSAQLRFKVGNHWRLQVAGNWFFGADPYKKVGFFRDRDEINVKIVYQF